MLADAGAADYRVAGINARLEPELLVPRAWPATRRDNGGARRRQPLQGMAQLRYRALIRFITRVTSLVIVR